MSDMLILEDSVYFIVFAGLKAVRGAVQKICTYSVTQGDSWALCPTVSAVSLASKTPCTNIEDLKTLITVYSMFL